MPNNAVYASSPLLDLYLQTSVVYTEYMSSKFGLKKRTPVVV